MAVLCPEKDAVLSTIADTRLDPCGVQRIYDAFFEEVYPGLDGPAGEPVLLSPETQGLEDRAGCALAASPVYVFEGENPLGLRSLSLSGDCLYYENARGKVELPFGRGRNRRIAYPGHPEVPALACGGWVEKDLLRVRCFAVGHAPCGFDMLLRFGAERVTVQCRRSHDPVTEGYDGVASGRAD